MNTNDKKQTFEQHLSAQFKEWLFNKDMHDATYHAIEDNTDEIAILEFSAIEDVLFNAMFETALHTGAVWNKGEALSGEYDEDD